MAKDNREIEIKTQVSRSMFKKISLQLKTVARFIKTSKQLDTYYSPKGKLYLRPKYPYEWLSVRVRDGKVKLNYKHWYPENKKITKYCDEYEIVVDNKVQLENILSALNFEKLVSVNKIRDVYINKDLEIALDEVDGLGYFVEIESLNNRGGVEKTINRIKKFGKSLGINKFDHISGGYAAELMRKNRITK